MLVHNKTCVIIVQCVVSSLQAEKCVIIIGGTQISAFAVLNYMLVVSGLHDGEKRCRLWHVGQKKSWLPTSASFFAKE